MTLFGKALRALAVVLAMGAGSMTAKPAKADGGAVVAGIAGGLILGTIIGSTANANNHGYYAPAPRYHAPAPVYVPRVYSRPSVSFSFGSYYAPRHYRQRGHGYRHYRGHRGYRGYRGHRRHYRRHH